MLLAASCVFKIVETAPTTPVVAGTPPNPLREAVRLHAHGWVESLRASGFVERNAPGPDGRTALEMAIETTDVRLVRAVLSMGGVPDVLYRHGPDDEEIRDKHRLPSLILALKANRILLGRIAELRLHGASGRDDDSSVATLISQWPDLINAGELVTKLLGASTRHTRTQSKANPKSKAKMRRARARARARLAEGRWKRSTTQDEDILLQDMRDVFNGRITEIVRLLIDHGANVDRADGWGEPPLVYAARLGFAGAVKLLLEKGADACRPNAWGLTAEAIALTQGFDAVVEVLQEKASVCDHSAFGFGVGPVSNVAHEGVVDAEAGITVTMEEEGGGGEKKTGKNVQR